MAINDQIRDEKLQYDINREAAKVSTLSSGQTHKYEYLTGEDILPSKSTTNNRTHKIYLFSFGKSFWKSNKNNWRSRSKAGWCFRENLKDQNKQLVNVNDDYEEKLQHSKEREIFRNIYNKRPDKTEEITKKNWW